MEQSVEIGRRPGALAPCRAFAERSMGCHSGINGMHGLRRICYAAVGDRLLGRCGARRARGGAAGRDRGRPSDLRPGLQRPAYRQRGRSRGDGRAFPARSQKQRSESPCDRLRLLPGRNGLHRQDQERQEVQQRKPAERRGRSGELQPAAWTRRSARSIAASTPRSAPRRRSARIRSNSTSPSRTATS